MDNAEIKRRLTTLRDDAKTLQEELYENIGDASNSEERDNDLDNLQGELRDTWQDFDNMIENLASTDDEGDGIEEENEDEVEEAEPEK